MERLFIRGRLAAVLLLLSSVAHAEEPRPLPKGLTGTPPGARVVAYIHGNVPITRDELADFLIARGGESKIELLVNKRIVETEAARQGVSVTPNEIQAALEQDLKGVQQKEVVTLILQRYGKTMLEWREDVVRPRLLLGKLVREKLQVTEQELRDAHETRYGEKRQARVIVWTKKSDSDTGPSPQVAAAIRSSDEEFDKIAANQSDPQLARSRGQMLPIGRFANPEDPTAINKLFSLPVGQTSELFETKDKQGKCTGWMIVKCVAVIPPEADRGLEKPAIRSELEQEIFDRKIGEAIPKLFDTLKTQYKATVVACNPTDVKPASFTVPAPVLPMGGPEQVLVTLSGPDGPFNLTRADLGEYLIMHRGAEALELLVNRRIIQIEAAKRGIAFTQEEIDAAFAALVNAAGPNITKEIFVEKILPARKKSLYEYIEDVVKPDVVMRKMVRERVKVSDEDMRKAFERKYGEKRACEIIIWRKGEERVALNEWNAIRNKQKTFEQVASMQADPNLAAAAGRVPPVGRHLEAEDPVIEKVVFDLPVGQMSHLLQTRAGTMCIRCTGTVPPDASVKFEDVKATLEREEFEKAVTKEMPVFFAELKKAAGPSLLLQTGTVINAEQVRQDAKEAQKKP